MTSPIAVVVRRATDQDAAALAKLRWEWRTEEAGESGMAWADFRAAFADWMVRHRESHTAWLAEEDGEPCGMAWLAVVHRVPGPAVWTRLAGTLQSVYVRPARRNRGLGLAFVQAAVAEARRQGLDYLEVHPSPRSVPMYRRAGFSDTDQVLRLDLGPA